MAALNLSWITDDLAIGGCLSEECVEELVREHRVGAIIDLRQEACDDEALLRRHGVALRYLPTPDMYGPSREMLVHCHFGIGRSATLALCVLVALEHEALALALAKARRPAVSPSQVRYEAWAAWLAARRHEAPTFEAFAQIAYSHLRQD